MQNQPANLFNASIQVDGTEDRFQGIHQPSLLGPAARLFFALTQLQIIAQLDSLRIFHQVGGTDEKALQLRQLSFCEIGVSLDKRIRNEEARSEEHTSELQSPYV